MAMSRDYRKVLDRCLVQLCSDLDVDSIMPPLMAEGLITESDRDRLGAEAVRSKRVSDFVSILKRKGGRAFEVFVKALREDEGSKHLAVLLEEVYNGINIAQPSQVPMQASD